MTVISASTGSASARAAISGPIPRGSPSVTATRGLPPFLSGLSVFSVLSLRPNLDIRRLTQPIDVPADGQLLPELVADAFAHVLEADIALRAPAGHLQDHELLVGAGGAGQLKHRHHRARVGLADDF